MHEYAYCNFEKIPSIVTHRQQESTGRFNAVITPIKLDVKMLIASISDGTLANYCKITPRSDHEAYWARLTKDL